MLTASWADGAGEGKRYKGAEIECSFAAANSGDCPITKKFSDSKTTISVVASYGALSEIELQPRESVTWTNIERVKAEDVKPALIRAPARRPAGIQMLAEIQNQSIPTLPKPPSP